MYTYSKHGGQKTKYKIGRHGCYSKQRSPKLLISVHIEIAPGTAKHKSHYFNISTASNFVSDEGLSLL